MNIELKNVKHSEFASHETPCFQASVYIGGKRAFQVSNDGQGGCHFYHPFDQVGKTLFKQAFEYAQNLPKRKYEEFGGFEVNMDLDMIINDLFGEWQENQTLKKWCKTHTVLKDDGGYFLVDHPYSDAVKKYVSEKHPMATIINERFLTN